MPAPTAANQPSESSASVALPPGMVLGPDGKPCRTCTDWKGWKKLTKSAKPNDNSGSTTAATAATAAAAAATSASASSSNSEPGKTFNYEKECPPDREVLGRATWTFLHTMSAYYPEKPSDLEQKTMKSLLSSFSQFYPCGHCAEHLREEMKVDPPKVGSRKELSWWMCGMHNKVNEMLGKEIFDCKKLDERWKDGPADGRCD